jgi:hypothetical protein
MKRSSFCSVIGLFLLFALLGCAGILQEGAVKPQEPSPQPATVAPSLPPVPDESETIRAEAKEMLLGKWKRQALGDDTIGHLIQRCRAGRLSRQLPYPRQGPDRDHHEKRRHPDMGVCRYKGGDDPHHPDRGGHEVQALSGEIKPHATRHPPLLLLEAAQSSPPSTDYRSMITA